MAVRGDTTEGLGLLQSNSIETKQSDDFMSPEDVAWADSCLIRDPEILESGWDSLKDALLEARSSESYFSAIGSDNAPQVADADISPSGERIRTSLDLCVSVDASSSNEGAEKNRNDYITDEDGKFNWAKVFLPTYNEYQREIEASDSEDDSNIPAYAMEQSTVNIFKVWDLDIPSEEDDELVQQFNKVLAECSLEPVPSVSDDSSSWRHTKDQSLDDLISGIADLSLTQKST